MPRALTMHPRALRADERAGFVAVARRRAAHFAGAGCRYWVFEEAAAPGRVVEFCEGPDAPALAAAHASAPDPLDGAPLHTQLEFA